MAWTTPLTAVANTSLTAAQWNASVRDNLNETAPAKATTSGGWFVATGLNSIAQRLPDSDFKTAADTTASTSYVSTLGGGSNGPTVTVTSGAQALVIITGTMFNNTVNGRGLIGINVTSASTILASDDKALSAQSSTANAVYAASVVYYENGLTPGSNTFACVYKVTSGTGTFDDRRLTVIPMS